MNKSALEYGIVYEISYANNYDSQQWLGHFWGEKNKHFKYSAKDFAQGGVLLRRASITQNVQLMFKQWLKGETVITV